jgi:ABC-type uncharacterized transport system permease subunit
VNAAILFHIGLAAYTISAAAHLWWLVRPADLPARIGARAMGVGFLFHGAAVVIRAQVLLEAGTFSFAEGLSFLAFLTVGSYLLLRRSYQLPVIGAFVAPLVIAVLIPAHMAQGAQVPIDRSLMGAILPIHIAVALAGLALFALGFGVAVMYLLLEREVKAKRLGAMFRRLPSLDLLDRLTYRLVVLGFVFLSCTIVSGALFVPASAAGTPFFFQPKQAFSLIAWGLVAAVVLLRHSVGWRGRKVAVATMASFVLLASAYAGVFAAGAAP